MVVPTILRKLHCVAAMDTKRGIGKDGNLPWYLPKEMKSFAKLTTSVKCKEKKNAVIMGRLTYFSIPEKVRPLKNRLNIVLSNTLQPCDLPENVLLYKDLRKLLETLSSDPYLSSIESLFVIGGNSMYTQTINSNFCQRIYLTEICGDYNCDIFFPEFDKNRYKEITLPDTCHEEQEEKGTKYQLHVYSSGEQ